MTSTPPGLIARPPWRLQLRRRVRGVRRVLLARRRLLAAALAAVAVVAAVRAVAPAPPATVEVLVAARDLPPGTTLAVTDLERRTVAADLAPPGVAGQGAEGGEGGGGGGGAADLVGRTVAGPVAAGEQLTPARLVGPSLAEAAPGRTAMPVRLADAGAAGLLRAGDRVDLVAADLQGGPGSVAVPVAGGVDVLAVPSAGEPGPASVGGGVLPGRLVVVAVAPEDVTTLAQATAAGFVTYTWVGS